MAMHSNMKQEILLESGTGELEILVFQINGIDFGVNVAKVREIITANHHITPVPNSDDRVIGIFSPRDECINAIDLKKCLFMKQDSDVMIDKESNEAVQIPKNRHFIICHFNDITQGWLVDNVCNILRVAWSEILPPSGVVSLDTTYVTGLYNKNGHLVQIIDFESIMVDIFPSDSFISNSNYLKTENVDKIRKKNLTVYIADDSKMFNKLITKTVSEAGYHVVSYINGQELYDKLLKIQNDESSYPDVIITDVEMPVLDGLTLCRMIKEHNKLRRIPVLIFSSLIDEAMFRKCKTVQANGAFSKPEIGQVIDFIHNAIEEEKKKYC